MERIQALIEQLNQQQKQNASPAQLLLTVQMLHSELLMQQRRNGSLGTAKVAVTLPSMALPADADHLPDVSAVKQTEFIEAAEEQVENVPEEIRYFEKPEVEEKPEETPEPVAETKTASSYTLRKPTLFDTPAEPEKPQTQAPGIAAEHRAYLPSFEQEDEVPTLIQHQGRKELNDLVAQRQESLNDKLKEPKKELAHLLKESPVKDLRKAIGINDRFLFVNELFRGDEAMYERSIKTINSFHVLSEAEYWINRELKVKLGWDDEKDTVQHFYHLVRRRFA